LVVLAWLWVRAVKSPNPAFRETYVPLTPTFWLSTKPGTEAYVEPVMHQSGCTFRVHDGKPKQSEKTDDGTKLARGSFRCLYSNTPIPYEYIDEEANAGRMISLPMAIVAEGPNGRIYLDFDTKSARMAVTAEPGWKPDAPSRGTWASNAQGRYYGFH